MLYRAHARTSLKPILTFPELVGGCPRLVRRADISGPGDPEDHATRSTPAAVRKSLCAAIGRGGRRARTLLQALRAHVAQQWEQRTCQVTRYTTGQHDITW